MSEKQSTLSWQAFRARLHEATEFLAKWREVPVEDVGIWTAGEGIDVAFLAETLEEQDFDCVAVLAIPRRIKRVVSATAQLMDGRTVRLELRRNEAGELVIDLGNVLLPGESSKGVQESEHD